MPAFTNEINYGPMLLTLLQVPELQISQLAASKSAPQQDGKDRPVPLSFEGVCIWRLPQATGFVGRAATSDRGSASGLYLASYFSGGLIGSAVLGQLFDRLGWAACVCGIGLSLAVAALLAARLVMPALQKTPGSSSFTPMGA